MVYSVLVLAWKIVDPHNFDLTLKIKSKQSDVIDKSTRNPFDDFNVFKEKANDMILEAKSNWDTKRMDIALKSIFKNNLTNGAGVYFTNGLYVTFGKLNETPKVDAQFEVHKDNN